MTTSKWNGNGDWDLNPADWSSGIPTLATSVEIQSGSASLSSGGIGEALSLAIDSGAALWLGDSVVLTVVDGLTNSGTWSLGAGDTVSIGTRLINSGRITIGYSSMAGSTTVTAASLANTGSGTIVIYGNAGAGAVSRSTLQITDSNSATVTGTLAVLGDADLALATGLTKVASGAALQVVGAQADISLGLGASNSALSGLTRNAGWIDFEGNRGDGYGGVTVATTVSFTNAAGATLIVDGNGSGDGGSRVTFGGALVNAGTINIGNSQLGQNGSHGSTLVVAQSLDNAGALNLLGNAASGTTYKATLKIIGAAPTTSTGRIQVGGDATLQFGSGVITTIGYGAWFELDGAQAQVLTNGGAASALVKLTTVYGFLLLRGNSNWGAGGAAFTTTTGLTNSGTIDVDSFQNSDSGSAVVIGGAIANNGYMSIGNGSMGASTTVSATALASNYHLVVQGAVAGSGATLRASLVFSGAAAPISTGYLRVSGDGLIQYGSGVVTTVGYGGWLELDGSGAQILTNGGAASALAKLTTNSGTLLLRGNSGLGAGGATLTTTTGLTNYGTVYVDSYGNGDCGSQVTIGGTLANNGALSIGNFYMGASTTVSATALVNNYSLTVQGNGSAGTSNRASLLVSGAAAATSTGFVRVGGDGLIQYGSGSVATIAGGSWLELDGSQAQILTNGGAASALAKLTTNNGTLLLRGNSGVGAGGATLTTTTGLTNYGTVYVDSWSNGDSGSQVNIGGALVNEGAINIGNGYTGAATTVTVASLVNDSSIALVGGSGLAELVVNGAATSDGVLSIGSGSELLLSGSNSFTQAGGTTTVTGSLVASAVNANDGFIDFRGAITSGGIGAFNIGDLGTLEFDAGVDSTHTIAFKASDGTLALGDAGAFSGKISGFAGQDAIDLLGQSVTGLSYASGALTATLAGGGSETIAFSGSYSTASFTFASDGHGGTDILHS